MARAARVFFLPPTVGEKLRPGTSRRSSRSGACARTPPRSRRAGHRGRRHFARMSWGWLAGTADERWRLAARPSCGDAPKAKFPPPGRTTGNVALSRGEWSRAALRRSRVAMRELQRCDHPADGVKAMRRFSSVQQREDIRGEIDRRLALQLGETTPNCRRVVGFRVKVTLDALEADQRNPKQLP